MSTGDERHCGNQALYQCILYVLFAVIGACFGVMIYILIMIY